MNSTISLILSRSGPGAGKKKAGERKKRRRKKERRRTLPHMVISFLHTISRLNEGRRGGEGGRKRGKKKRETLSPKPRQKKNSKGGGKPDRVSYQVPKERGKKNNSKGRKKKKKKGRMGGRSFFSTKEGEGRRYGKKREEGTALSPFCAPAQERKRGKKLKRKKEGRGGKIRFDRKTAVLSLILHHDIVQEVRERERGEGRTEQVLS